MTNFATAFLENVQAQLWAEIQQKKLQLADVNEALLKLGGEPSTPDIEIAPPPAGTAFAEPLPERPTTFTDGGALPASIAPTPHHTVAHVPEPDENGVGEAVPVDDVLPPEDDDTPPWKQQEQSDAPAEPTSGRRTNEQIAAEHGVDLKDVKAFAEKQGVKRVTKGLIEEYATMVRNGGAPGGGGAQPSLISEATSPEALARDALPVATPTAAQQEASEPDASDFEDGDASAEVYEPPF